MKPMKWEEIRANHISDKELINKEIIHITPK